MSLPEDWKLKYEAGIDKVYIELERVSLGHTLSGKFVDRFSNVNETSEDFASRVKKEALEWANEVIEIQTKLEED